MSFFVTSATQTPALPGRPARGTTGSSPLIRSGIRMATLAVWSALLTNAASGQETLVRKALWGQPTERRAVMAGLLHLESTRERVRAIEAAIRAGRAYQPISAEREDIPVTLEPGHTTTLYVQLPPNYDPAKSYPFMLAHGGGPMGTKTQADRTAKWVLSIWSEPASKAGWIVAAVVDTVSVSRSRQPPRHRVLNGAHARAILDAIIARYHVDPNRIHATGVWLGADYSLAHAAAHPDWFAGVVPVSTEGESREYVLRNINQVGVYVLGGVRGRSVRALDGPRKLAEILTAFGYRHVYDEHKDRGHESFKERYPDVLDWLATRPRDPFPKTIIRVAHPGIMMPAKRFFWLEADTRQAIFHAEVTDNTIDVHAARARVLTFHLSDRLVNLDKPVTIRVNGQVVHDSKIARSIRVALEDAAALNDTERFATARLRVPVPNLPDGEAWVKRLEPKVMPGELAFWEGYAVETLREDRSTFPATVEPIGSEVAPGLTGLRVTAVEKGSPLLPGDVITAVDDEPCFAGTDAIAFINAYILRTMAKDVTVSLLRDGKPRRVSVTLSIKKAETNGGQ